MPPTRPTTSTDSFDAAIARLEKVKAYIGKSKAPAVIKTIMFDDLDRNIATLWLTKLHTTTPPGP